MTIKDDSKKKKRTINYPITDTTGKIQSVTVDVDDDSDAILTMDSIKIITVTFNENADKIDSKTKILPIKISFTAHTGTVAPSNLYLNQHNIYNYPPIGINIAKEGALPQYQFNLVYSPVLTEPDTGQDSDTADITWAGNSTTDNPVVIG